MTPAIAVRGLEFSQKGRAHRLTGIDVTVQSGQISCLLGPNGSGKSTLLRCMLGLLPITGGTVEVHGRNLPALSARERAKLVAYVPQSTATTFPFTTADIAVMGRTPHLPPGRTPGRRDRQIAQDVLADLGIAHLAEQSFASLSGGQQAMTMLARALVQQAPVMVLDEPTAALDLGNATTVLEVVTDLARRGHTIVMTTHQPEHALWVGDHVTLLAEGRVIGAGAPGDVLTSERLSAVYGIPVVVAAAEIPGRADAVPTCVPELGRTRSRN